MLKYIFSLVLCVLLLQTAKAEHPDSVVYYLKNSGKKVLTKDSADFYRVILPPDTNLDKDRYRVFDYYSNGKLKSVATSLTAQLNLVLDGTCIDYFPNGKRKTTLLYKNGRLTGTVTHYYPNGKFYYSLNIEDQNYGYFDQYYRGYLSNPAYGYKLQIIEFRDSTGNLLASNGTGHITLFDEDFKKVTEEGDLNKNKKEGEWKGLIADSGRFTCIFHKDELKSGTSYINSGNRYNFKKLYVNPVFSDGMDAFYIFIKKNLQYPESARNHNVMGSVEVEFYVEPNGTVSDVTVVQSLFKSCDDEAVRVISMSPLWIPAYKFGIPVRTRYRVSVRFSKY